MPESDSRPQILRIGLGVAIAAVPILVTFAATQLLNAGVLVQPGGLFMVSITPLFFASALLIPIGLLIVGLLIGDGASDNTVSGCVAHGNTGLVDALQHPSAGPGNDWVDNNFGRTSGF